VLESPATSAISATAAEGVRECPLAACAVGSRATVLAMRWDDVQACRLRALGVCEGACVSVLETRHAMVLDVRGTRLALGRALTAGITVRPLPV
jgi:ferrous iron transport protein A